TDEHGLKIERKAQTLGRAPQDWVDEISGSVRTLFDALRISHDDFIRTTEQRHTAVVQQIFTRLYQQGDIYLGHYEGWYCQYEEAFWPESRVAPGNLCPECGRPLEWTREPVYRFRLSAYAAQVEALLRRPDFLIPESRRNEVLTFLREGLEDTAVSRTSVGWGIPVPFDPQHTIYVWIDALANYISALGYGTAADDLYRRFWPADVHVVGKDITRFHAVIWPALLLALGEPLPRQILGHGWLNVNGEKISKSRGNGVDPQALIQQYGVDAIRYYLLRETPFDTDGNYTEESLVLRINNDLANDLGNLLSRVTQLIVKFAGGVIPEPTAVDGVLVEAAREAVAAAQANLDRLHIADALADLWRLVNQANKYIEVQAPWALARDPGQNERLNGVLYSLAESLRILAVALTPYLVETPEEIYRQLGLDAGAVRGTQWPDGLNWGQLPAGTAVKRGAPLFPRIG
ncbi:MAG: methionine--tRNA ligase, partial [Mycobacterium leprae]